MLLRLCLTMNFLQLSQDPGSWVPFKDDRTARAILATSRQALHLSKVQPWLSQVTLPEAYIFRLQVQVLLFTSSMIAHRRGTMHRGSVASFLFFLHIICAYTHLPLYYIPLQPRCWSHNCAEMSFDLHSLSTHRLLTNSSSQSMYSQGESCDP